MGLFSKIAAGLRKTKDSFLGGLQRIFNSFTKIDEELFEELEEQMIMSDIGVDTSVEICDQLRKKVKERGITDPKDIMELIHEVIAEMMGDDTGLDLSVSPAVIMVIGVNGAGKTTTIGKLCHQFKNEGKKVLVAAADTFRAAAIDQLQVWTDRAGVDIVKHSEGSDPGAVVYDALEAAKARGCDVVIIDTAGRLHNKKNLMEELKKINRIIDNKAGECSREILLVHAPGLRYDRTEQYHVREPADVFVHGHLGGGHVYGGHVRPLHLPRDQGGIHKDHPARPDGALIFVKRGRVHHHQDRGMLHDGRSDRRIAQDHVAIRGAAAHLRPVGRQPAEFPSFEQSRIREHLSGKEQSLSAETGNNNLVALHLQASLLRSR